LIASTNDGIRESKLDLERKFDEDRRKLVEEQRAKLEAEIRIST